MNFVFEPAFKRQDKGIGLHRNSIKKEKHRQAQVDRVSSTNTDTIKEHK